MYKYQGTKSTFQHIYHQNTIHQISTTNYRALLRKLYQIWTTNYRALLRKSPVKIRHPMLLRHPVTPTLHSLHSLYTHNTHSTLTTLTLHSLHSPYTHYTHHIKSHIKPQPIVPMKKGARRRPILVKSIFDKF